VQVPNYPLEVPVVTINGIGDQISPVAAEQAYESVVGSENLRQLYTLTAGHCGFNGREIVAAVEVLQLRAESGEWPDTSPDAMNQAAEQVQLNGTPRFIEYEPDQYARPFKFVRVRAESAAPVIALHGRGLVWITLTPESSAPPEFSAANIDPQSIRLAGAAPVSYKMKHGSLLASFRANELTGLVRGADVSLPLTAAYIYGVPIDEEVRVAVR